MNALVSGTASPEELKARDFRDIAQILDATAKDPGGSLNIRASDQASVQVTINYNSVEANAIQNQAYKQIEVMKEPEQKLFSKRLMYWHAATRGRSSKTTDKAVIESITDKALPVYIPDEELKQKMLAGRENPFLVGFVVDVELLTVKGEVRGYTVKHLYETLEDAPEDGLSD